jgi:hypothetical protein
MRRFLLVVVLATALTGCKAASPASAPTAGTDLTAELALARQFVACGRNHGHAGLTDPSISNGKIDFTHNDPAAKQALFDISQVPECKAILDQIPDTSFNEHPVPDASQMQALLAFAQCMRDHGIPEWPDPRPDGTFPIIGTPLEAEGKSGRFLAANDACKQYYGGGINAS